VAELVHAGAAPSAPVLRLLALVAGLRAFADLPWVRPVLTARTALELRRLRRRLAVGPAPYGVSLHGSLLSRPVVGPAARPGRGRHDLGRQRPRRPP
jgi:hypothetical protein